MSNADNELAASPLVDFDEIRQSGVYRVRELPAPMSIVNTGIYYMQVKPEHESPTCFTYMNIIAGPPDRIGELWYFIQGKWTQSWKKSDDSEPQKPLFSKHQENRIREMVREVIAEGDER